MWLQKKMYKNHAHFAYVSFYKNILKKGVFNAYLQISLLDFSP